MAQKQKSARGPGRFRSNRFEPDRLAGWAVTKRDYTAKGQPGQRRLFPEDRYYEWFLHAASR